MKIKNFKLKIVFFALLLLFVVAKNADAAVLKRPPNNLGLVGYWSFNEGTSTIATDFSGNGNRGVLTNIANPPTSTSGWTNGKIGQALNFDGSNDFVTIPDASSLKPVTTISYSAWVYPRAIGSAQSIFEKGNTNTAGYALVITSGGKFCPAIKTTSGHMQGSSNTNVQLNTWQHIAATYDGTTLTFYLNGVKDTLITAGCGILNNTGDITHDTSALTFGMRTGATLPFDGLIDDVRIYNRVLNADEVKALYDSGAVKHTTPNNLGLVGYWSFNEGTSTIATDFSGNGNRGVLTNIANPPTATSGWANGKRGKALNFDGSDDSVDIATTTLSGQFTVSLWWKNADNAGTRIAIGTDADGSGTTQKIGGNLGNLFVRIVSSSDSTIALPSQDAWHFFVVTRDASNKVDLYVDNGAANRLFANAAQTGDFTPSRIGSAGTANQEFNGLIDDVRIYNRALGADEVKALYNSGYAKINAPQNDQMTMGLVGMWSFNGPDLTTTTAFDRSGQANNGTLTNGPVPAIGKIGQALNFDGSNDHILFSTSNFRSTDSAGAISVWFKTNSTTNVLGFIGSSDTVDVTNYLFFGLNFTGTAGSVYQQHDEGAETTSQVRTTNGGFNDGNWHHAVLVSNGSSYLIYIDGVNQALTVAAGANDGDWFADISARDNFTIGNLIRSSAIAHFPGLIDDVRVYNRALTAAEVKQLYNMGK